MHLLAGLTTIINDKNKTLYMSAVKNIEEQTRGNLTMSLAELGLYDGASIMVSDVNMPTTITLQLKYHPNEVEMK